MAGDTRADEAAGRISQPGYGARGGRPPACRRGLRIEVDDNGGEAVALRSAGSGDGERGLVHAVFPRDDGDDFPYL